MYLSEGKATTLSAFHMYEFHTVQQGTDIHPGQNADLDYSVAHMIRVNEDTRLQLAVVGYGQWQTTDKTGPTITTAQGTAHYAVNALGFATNVSLPAQSKPGPEVLQGVLESIHVSRLHTADLGGSDLLAACRARRLS